MQGSVKLRSAGTLEGFVAGKEAQEVSDLKQHADQLPTDKQGEFWAWHYPGHWNDQPLLCK
jgi:hypothetical protein